MEETQLSDFGKLYRAHQYDTNEILFKPLWHYTSANGLMGIVRNKEEEYGKLHFWFTRSDCLNDTSEGKHVLTVYQTVCEELYQNGEISEAFYNSIIKAELSNHIYINYALPSEETNEHRSVLDCVACHAFICSFSTKEDSLDMWRYYSKGDGGYGLKLAPFLFGAFNADETSEQYEEKFCKIRYFRVIYKDSEKTEIIKRLILDTFSYYGKFQSLELGGKNDAVLFIQNSLKQLQFRFKHECYSTEQEYRFVIYRPYGRFKAMNHRLPKIHYRNQNGVLIPYIDIPVENGDMCLQEVRVSPFIENEMALDTTCEYIDACGFHCTTQISELPVRK